MEMGARRISVCAALAGIAVLLAIGCSKDKAKDQGGGASSDESAGAEEPSAPVAAATPWKPRIEDARFFSRPADSWKEGPLELVSYGLSISTAGGVATSTLDVQVANRTEKQAEAVIVLPVAPDAAVTAATLWVGEEPQKGVLMNRGRAREVYDKIVDRRRDPLLVEWGGSDLLGVSVFPVEAGQTRRFALTWVEPMVGGRVWVASFRHKEEPIGYPSEITVDGKARERDGDWVAVPAQAELADADYRLELQKETTPSAISVVLDTSRATTMSRQQQWAEVEKLVAGLGGRSSVTLLAADWFVTELGSGQTASDLAKAKAAFMEIRAAGRLDSIQAAAKAFAAAGPKGVVTMIGTNEPYALTHAAGGVTVPAYWVGRAGARLLGTNVGSTSGRLYLDAAEIGKEARPLVPPAQPDFDWAPLETASGHVVWVGRKRDVAAPGDAAPRPAEALFYRARWGRDEQIPLGKILSPATSILVLESKEQYEDWGIDPYHPPQEDAVDQRAYGLGTIGAGSSDLFGARVGTPFDKLGPLEPGMPYGGIGTGVMAPPRVGKPPVFRLVKMQAAAGLDKMIVRRYLRRKLPLLRYCYEKELSQNEDLGGKLTLAFTIDPTGRTAQVNVTMDGKNTEGVADCVKQVVEKMQLPKPRDEKTVKVSCVYRLVPNIDKRWRTARDALARGDKDIVQEIATAFALKDVEDEVDLAWRLADTELAKGLPPPRAFVIVATLLKRNSDAEARDARRVLSEGATRHAKLVADTFREWGFEDDAKRIEALVEKKMLGDQYRFGSEY